MTPIFTIQSTGDVPKILLRMRDQTNALSGITIQVVGANVQVYAGSTSLANQNLSHTPAVGDAMRMRAKLTGNLLTMWVMFNGGAAQILRFKLPTLNMFYGGYFGFGYFGPSANVQVSQCVIGYVPADALNPLPVSPTYRPSNDLMGAVQYGDFTANPDSLGGDLIHHTSDVGSNLFMIPAAARWVKQLIRKIPEWLDMGADFTPALYEYNASAGTKVAIANTNCVGKYSRRGNKVTVQIFGSFSAAHAMTGGTSLLISGPLPNVGTPATLTTQALALGTTIGIVPVSSASTQLVAEIDSGATGILVRGITPSTGGYSEIGALNNGGFFSLSGTFYVNGMS